MNVLAKKDFRDTKRGQFYWPQQEPYLGKQPFVSVTQILEIISKPQLTYWYGREVFYAMVKDPSMKERDALAAPYKTSDSAKNRGSLVHSIVEAYKTSGIQIETVPQEYRPYAQAFYKWVRDFNPTFVENEKTVLSTKFGYAGTLDALINVGGKAAILDVKTGKAIYPEVQLQLSAYKQALLESGTDVQDMYTLLLETGADGLPTGNYIYRPMPDVFEYYLNAQKLWYWNNQDVCLKVNYKLPSF